MAIINGTGGNDTLNGTNSGDRIYGFGGSDELYGNGGNDQLDGGTGSDLMVGGTGNDIYFVDDDADVVVELESEGTDEVRTTLLYYALGSDVEHLRFTGSGDFTGIGNFLNNDIYGGTGNDGLDGGDGYDYLSGGAGSDTLIGGGDGDTLVGGTGADYLEGNTGDDVYIVDNAGDTVVELSGEGHDVVYSNLATYTLPDEIEDGSWNSFTGSWNVTGNVLGNTIWAGNNADAISGLDGDDTLRAAGGDDSVDGGDGADLIVGGGGADTMTGGLGADTFRIGYYESGTGSAADRITDFEIGTDVIDLAGWDADINVGGDQAFTFVGTDSFTLTAGELRYYDDGTDTYIQGDIGGDGIADFEIRLDGLHALSGPDFVL